MKALVTGGTGFLGRHLVERLALEGDDVSVLARGGSRAPSFAALGAHRGRGRRAAAGRRCAEPSEGMDVIYHCAGKVEAGGRWVDFLEVNVLGTERLIQAALEHGVRRIVHVSSIGVYPERPDGAVISEDDGYDDNPGRGGYTRSKIMADQLAFWYARSQSAPITVIRPATIYGPGGKNNLVRVGVKKGRFNVIFGDGGSIMPLVYVDNVVDALVLAARRDEAHRARVQRGRRRPHHAARVPRAHGRGARGGRSPRRICRSAPCASWPAAPISRRRRCAAGKRSPQGMFSRISRSLQSVRYDTTRAKTELGWKPRVDFEEALRRVMKDDR